MLILKAFWFIIREIKARCIKRETAYLLLEQGKKSFNRRIDPEIMFFYLQQIIEHNNLLKLFLNG